MKNAAFTNSGCNSTPKVDVQNITEMFAGWRKEMVTRFASVPVKIDKSLEGNQYYIAVSQEIYDQVEKEQTRKG